MGLRGYKTVGAADGQAVRLLVARCAGSHIAFPSSWVRGLITQEEAGTERHVTWAGASYERTDLMVRLKVGMPTNTVDSRMILYGNEQRACAFLVDDVVGLIDAPRDRIQPLPPQFRSGERERIVGLFADDAHVALIANPLWVLELPMRPNVLDGMVLQSIDPRSRLAEVQLQLAASDEAAAPQATAAPAR